MALRATVTAVLAALGGMGAAHAFEVDTGNPDLEVRLDNTIRYTYGHRMSDPSASLTGPGSHNIDDGNRNFEKGDATANRLDLLTEFDFVYARRHGFRVSASAWADHAYDRDFSSSQPLSQSNHLDAAGRQAYGLSNAAKRYQRGLSGEFLDAFVFTGFDVGESKVNVKAGRHTLYWGESLYNFSNSISYSQTSVDLAKGLQMPGVEAKELFRPRNSISAQATIVPELTVAAQTFLDWEPYRYPNPGTYLSFLDVLGQGAESFIVNPATGVLMKRADDIRQDKREDFGISARYSPDWLGGTLGFYYRNYTDMQPFIVADLRDPTNLRYRQAYAGDVDLFGVSFGGTIGGISVGSELSYRRNAPLSSFPTCIGGAGGLPGLCGLLGRSVVHTGNTLPDAESLDMAARGNTFHFVLNTLGVISSTALFDAATWGAELNVVHLDKVTRGANLYKDQPWYTGIDKPDDTAVGIHVNFTPTWFGIFPSADLSLPMSYNIGISGNAPTQGNINEGLGSYSIGARLDYAQKHQFELRYVGYRGDVEYGPSFLQPNGASGPNVLTPNGAVAALSDREQIIFTYKTSF